MNVEQSTIDLVKKWEGVKYKVYKDVIGKDTIGVGHLILPTEESLLTKTLTEQEVNDLLRQDLTYCEAAIKKFVKVSLTQNQYDAICSFIFNLGVGAFSKSTLLKKINTKASKEEITAQFVSWCRAGGKIVNGLLLRRQAEAKLFNL